MSRMSRLASLLLVGTAACAPPPLTELVISVDSDRRLDRVVVEVTGPSGEQRAEGTIDSIGDLPVTLGVRAASGAPSVTVTATGYLAGAEAAHTTVTTSFVLGERRLLQMWLLDACDAAGPCTTRCDADGACVASDVDPGTLPAFDGTTPPHVMPTDAGVVDAGALDAGPPDAGLADAGLADAGRSDAGLADAGRPDAGPVDAGAECAVSADCSDDNRCTNDSCVSGRCMHSNVPDFMRVACDDGNSCSDGDTCTGGRCVASRSLANGAACDDGDACTTGDRCSTGRCMPTGSAVNGTRCDDHDMCTTGETCQLGSCSGGTAVMCTCRATCAPLIGCTGGIPGCM